MRIKNSYNGFTFLELMVAVAILLIVISGLLATFVYCIIMNETNNNLVVAANDAQFVMEEIKNSDYDGIGNYTPPSFYNLPNELLPAPTVINIDSQIKEITVNVNWTERERPRNFKLSTRIAR